MTSLRKVIVFSPFTAVYRAYCTTWGQGSEYKTTLQNIFIDQYVQENGVNFIYKDNELPDLRDRLHK
ncbi:unnamed protein product [Rotaria socialis]|uniref:Uncharacterized protein n=2 Tax=Rotaria TaxID=231623 RepID=A0A820SRF3_9BILA|nr:unnamed protein product [Rotaria magnacalcarata]CAF4159917.1 unnamed protein product [Rotaria socialis]CAF4458473.1 unnamed protein product [Rotaria socialis]CAF4461862.1 unnamed protein product [Rotaria socialis]CAF4525931.1 unnamed protein product [Rotaria socialis]